MLERRRSTRTAAPARRTPARWRPVSSAAEGRCGPGGGRARAARRRAGPARRRDDVDTGVGIVDPVDRHLVDPEAGALGQHEELGVEEPAAVLDQREQLPGAVGADRLEAALRVGEAGPERCVEDPVVRAGDHLALRAAHDLRSAGQPAPDRQVAVPGDERGDEREERGEVGGQVDVHVGEDVGVAPRPDVVKRTPAALLVEPDALDALELGREQAGDPPGAVGAGVVGDRDPARERKRPEVLVQPPDRLLELRLLVEDGDDDLEHRRSGSLGEWECRSHGNDFRPST